MPKRQPRIVLTCFDDIAPREQQGGVVIECKCGEVLTISVGGLAHLECYGHPRGLAAYVTPRVLCPKCPRSWVITIKADQAERQD